MQKFYWCKLSRRELACFSRNKFVTSFEINRPLGGLCDHAFVFHNKKYIYVELRLNLQGDHDGQNIKHYRWYGIKQDTYYANSPQ